MNAAELALIVQERSPGGASHEGWTYWKQLLSHPNTVALCLMYFPNSFVFYFCITWLPKYFEEKLGFEPVAISVFTGLPLVFGVVGVLAGGVTTDSATRRFGLRIGRSAVGAAGYLAAGGAMFLATLVHQPVLAALLFAAAVAASMFTLGAAWSTCLDIGGNHAGVVSAAMNTSGQIGSILSPLIVVYVQNAYGDWNVLLHLMGGLFVLGALCWGVIDPTRKVFA